MEISSEQHARGTARLVPTSVVIAFSQILCTPGCATVASAEAVGKSAESLNSYKQVAKSLGENCRLAKSIRIADAASTSDADICASIEADEKTWGRALKMFVDYGSAMSKLSARPKINGEDATSKLLSIADKLEWHTLDGDTTAALSTAAGILVQWLAREVRREELVSQAEKIDPQIQSSVRTFRTNLKLHLDTLCLADEALKAARDAPCAGGQCVVLHEAGRRATVEHLRVELRDHRIASIDMSVSLIGFAAAHGRFVSSSSSVGGADDRTLAKKIRADSESAGKQEKEALAKYIDCTL